MDELTKGLALIVTWYNSREGLVAPFNMGLDDFTITSFDNAYGDWTLTVMNKHIPDVYFMAVYEAEAHQTVVQQYRKVSEEVFLDSDLLKRDDNASR